MGTQDKTLTLVTLLCATQVLHESLDDLKETKFYKQSLKLTANRFEEELTKVCDPHIKKIFSTDEQTSNDVMDGIIEVAKELASLTPDSIAHIGMLIKAEKERYADGLDG